jgi:hypothetical protein
MTTILNRDRVNTVLGRYQDFLKSRRRKMPGKRFLIILTGFMIFVFAIIGFISVSAAHAQCGDNPPNSSCITCHEYEKKDSVMEHGEWHEIHALKDCCWNCHGGNTKAQDKDLAHAGMTNNPLNDIYMGCFSCHPEDYPSRADRFAFSLGIIPGASPTSTPVPVSNMKESSIIVLPTSQSHSSSSSQFPVAIVLVAFAIFFWFGLRMLYIHLSSTSKA